MDRCVLLARGTRYVLGLDSHRTRVTSWTQALSGLAHTPRALMTASQRALSVESMGSAGGSGRGFNNKRLTGVSGRGGRQGSPLAKAPVRAVAHSDDEDEGDINLLQVRSASWVCVMPKRLGNSSSVLLLYRAA